MFGMGSQRGLRGIVGDRPHGSQIGPSFWSVGARNVLFLRGDIDDGNRHVLAGRSNLDHRLTLSRRWGRLVRHDGLCFPGANAIHHAGHIVVNRLVVVRRRLGGRLRV